MSGRKENGQRNKLIIPASAISITALAIMGGMIYKEHQRTVQPPPATVNVSPDDLSATRQHTLDELVKDQRFVDAAQQTVYEVVYDEQFAKYKAIIQSYAEEAERTNDEALKRKCANSLALITRHQQPDAIAFAVTHPDDYMQMKGPCRIFVGSDLFTKLSNNEDRLSVLTHETYHAQVFDRGIPFTKEASAYLFSKTGEKVIPDTPHSGKLLSAFDEAYAYGMQLIDIFSGKYQVTPFFRTMLEEQYIHYAGTINSITPTTELDAAFKQTIIMSLPLQEKGK